MEKINLVEFKNKLNERFMEFIHPVKTDFHKDFKNSLFFEKSGYLSLTIDFINVFGGSGYISDIFIHSPITDNDLIYLDEFDDEPVDNIINEIVNKYTRLMDLVKHFQELKEEYSDLDLDNIDVIELIKI